MTRRMFRSFSLALAALMFLATFHQTALAGPPLLCHPFEIDGAQSLPFGSGSWRATRSDYDINRLADDTVALLGADVPVIVRMETLRRATIYAAKDRNIAAQLHKRLRLRAKQATGAEATLALFDLGYFKETYKQISVILEKGTTPEELEDSKLDGYSRVLKAIEMRGGDADMEFAAALIASHPRRDSMREHLRKAVAGANEGTLLARNLVKHFSDMGRTIGDLRASLKH